MVEFVSHGCREQQLEDCDSKGSNFVSSTEQSPLNNSAAAVSLDDWQHHAPPYHPSSPLWVSNDCFIFPWILSCWLIINFVLHFVMMLQHVLIPSPRLFSKNMMSLRSHMLIFWYAVGHRGHAANNCACCRTNQKIILFTLLFVGQHATPCITHWWREWDKHSSGCNGVAKPLQQLNFEKQQQRLMTVAVRMLSSCSFLWPIACQPADVNSVSLTKKNTCQQSQCHHALVKAPTVRKRTNKWTWLVL